MASRDLIQDALTLFTVFEVKFESVFKNAKYIMQRMLFLNLNITFFGVKM